MQKSVLKFVFHKIVLSLSGLYLRETFYVMFLLRIGLAFLKIYALSVNLVNFSSLLPKAAIQSVKIV